MRTKAKLFALCCSVLIAGHCAFAYAQDAAASETDPAPPRSADCGIAAPGCFLGCGQGQVHTLSGACIPAKPPTALSQPAGALRLIPSSESPADDSPDPLVPPSESPVDDSPGSPNLKGAGETVGAVDKQPCCLTGLRIDAVGTKNLGVSSLDSELLLDVRINGQLVGKTPLYDSLPAGDYLVEVAAAPGVAYSAMVQLGPDAPANLRADMELPLAPEEARVRDAWRLRRKQAVVDEQRAQERAQYLRDHGQWERSTAPIRAERSRLFNWGLVSGIAGLVLAGVGAGCTIAASSADDEAVEALDSWKTTLQPSEREPLAVEVRSAEKRRDTLQAVGVSSLVLGGIGTVAAVVLWVGRPHLLPEPRSSLHSEKGADRVGLWLWLAPDGAGLRIRM